MSLTRFPEGSVRELCAIAFPLMLSTLSVTTMIFVDRLLLAKHSSIALTSATNAMTLGWAFLFGWAVLTSISEVFVAQYNGAGQQNKLGEPVWQMIWVGIGSVLFFMPLVWSMDLWFSEEFHHPYERVYLKWMFLLGPSFPLYGALCGFFIGQGKTALVTWTAVFANIINACLDYLLIFGVEGFIEPLGVKGAAIATTGSSFFQILVLAIYFLSPLNRNNFGTNKWKLNIKLFMQCIKVGLPNAVFICVELLGWAAYYQMMSWLGERHITVASISQSIIIFLYFFADAINKASSTIAGNLIGAKKHEIISSVLWSGIKLHLVFFIVIFCGSYFFGEWVISYFLPRVSVEQLELLKNGLYFSLFSMCFYLFFEGIRMLYAGILTAAGDTVFLLLGGIISVWLFLVIPVFTFVYLGNRPIEWAFTICVLYSLAASAIYMWRFAKGPWKKLALCEMEIT